MAKRAIQLSCLDQENAMLKIEQWRKTEPDSTHFFRPFIEVNMEECPRETAPPPENTKNGGENSNTVHEKGSYKKTTFVGASNQLAKTIASTVWECH